MSSTTLWTVSCALFLALAGCPAPKEQSGQDGGAGAGADASAQPVFDHDYFPYYAGSTWSYRAKVENKRTGTVTNGGIVVRVKAFDDATKTATLAISAVMDDSCNNRVLYLRKSAEGLVEKASDPKWWTPVFHVQQGNAYGVSFVLTGDITRPSNMLGSVSTSVGAGSASVPAGTFTTLQVSAGYMPSGSDPYLYGDDATEQWDKAVGLVATGASWVDWSLGYGNYMSGGRSIELEAYSVAVPGGPALTFGTLPSEAAAPNAPIKLAAERLDATHAKVRWEDRALNETSFLVERKEASGAFAQVAQLDMDATEFADDAIGGGVYVYRVRAANAAGPSAYSEEAEVACDGAPAPMQSPAMQDLGSVGGHRMISVSTFAKKDCTGANVQVRPLGGAWVDASGTIPAGDLWGTWERNFSGYVFANSDQTYSVTEGATTIDFPRGTWQVRMRAINASCAGPWGNLAEILLP